jgi:Tol biopolymer transport system component
MKPLLSLAVVATIVSACSAAQPSASSTPTDAASVAVSGPAVGASRSPDPSRTAPSVPGSMVVSEHEAWIAFETGGRIHLARPDGSGEHVLTAAAGRGPESKADWSNDGQRLAFRVEDDDGTLDLWTANADGNAVELLFDCSDPCAWSDEPAWSPDDRSIAFQQGTTDGQAGLGLGSVRTIDVATRKVSVVFTGAATEYSFVPRWSPDGAAIVFELDRFDSSRLDASRVVEGTIGTLNLADPDPAFAPLQPWNSMAVQPDWSSTGGLILFQKPEGGELSDLHVIKIDGSGTRRLTDLAAAGGRALQASWTPAGDEAIFVAESNLGTGSIALIRADGNDQRSVPLPDGLRTHPRLRPTG